VIHVQDHKVIYSNRNNSAADCSTSLKFGTEYHHVTGDTLQMFKIKGQRSWSLVQRPRSERNVTYQQRKHYKTATDRLRNFELGIGVVIKADKNWRGVGRRQVAMHAQLPRFLVTDYFSTFLLQ